MTTITDIRTVAVTVADQDAAVDFYTRTLGFEVGLDAPMSPTMRWVEVAAPGAAVSLALVAGTPSAQTDTGVRFAVPDAATEHETLASGGVAVGELMRWDDVPPMFTFDDQDGNRFVVVEEVR